MYKLGIDLGGTKIEGVILDADNRQRFRQRIATEQEQGRDHILQNIKQLYDRMRDEIGDDAHTFGIGTPGALSPKTGLLRNSNTQCLNGYPLREDLEALLQRRVALQNDANCFAMAEAVLGAGAGHAMVFGVIMGTGCGGGIVYEEQVVTGRHAIAGEWGHTSIDPNGPACWCGNRGCVETFISGGGLEARFHQQVGVRKSAKEIVRNYLSGAEPETAVVGEFLRYFGRATANLINVLDPDIVVLGGGLSNIEALYREGAAEVRKLVFSDYCDTPIVKNLLGDSAGVIGAALIGV